MNLVMRILFIVASVLYVIDAVRVYRQDYGKIKMQLPVGLRRMNHNLIKKVSSVNGFMQSLMILAFAPIASSVPAFTEEIKGDVGLSSAMNSLSIIISIVCIVTILLITV